MNIPDRGTFYDTVTVGDYGTINDMHVTITSNSRYYNAQLVSPDGTIYQVTASARLEARRMRWTLQGSR